jgi:hypothetical protein
MAWIIIINDGDKKWAVCDILSEEEIPTSFNQELPIDVEVIKRRLINTPLNKADGPLNCWLFEEQPELNKALEKLTQLGYSAYFEEIVE